ncbi:hypothetical protein CKO31_17905 [Thiohalocapsa halophila]|uniref:Uncharacterized protein n=1 Tax=Thiohalocapsa halophila TaxID=69359 RepID=A0ABS1CKZ5_9GAMM|nr:hypothetical protein [Thiohalocapsa halophila]MBK1632582.1 hypothetical protein [Thiohalocapsa halophila]
MGEDKVVLPDDIGSKVVVEGLPGWESAEFEALAELAHGPTDGRAHGRPAGGPPLRHHARREGPLRDAVAPG